MTTKNNKVNNESYGLHNAPAIITKRPLCGLCKTNEGFILLNEYFVCGKCFQENRNNNDDLIIQEASRIILQRKRANQ